MNPEFRRYLWIELSAQRLVLMPVIIAAFVWLAVLVNDGIDDDVADAALWLFGALGLLWGTRLASESVISEISARTWDGQRLSSLGPWAMTWGKLFGSTVFVWYGCALLAAAFLGASLVSGATPERMLERLVLTSSCVLIAHAGSLLASLHAVRRRAGAAPARGAGLLSLGLLAAAPFLMWGTAASSVDSQLPWYSFTFDVLPFAIASSVAFAAWAVTGLYMLMRLELQRRNPPWVWLGFVGFVAVWVAGFGDAGPVRVGILGMQRWDDVATRLLIALVACGGLYYVALLVEPKDPVEFRRLAREAGAGRWGAALEVVPRWLVTLGVVFVVGAALIISTGAAGVPTGGVIGFVLGVWGFMVRDAAILVSLNLSPRPRRADAAGFLYLVVLYGLAPAILVALGLENLQGLLVPTWDSGLAGAGPALVQAAVMATWAASRWRGYRDRTPGAAT